jgi:uncharacterized protein
MRGGNVSAKDKEKVLIEMLKDAGELAVAFSGGVDSSYLVYIAHKVLGDRAVAVTALSPTYPDHVRKDAEEVAALVGIKHLIIESNELEIPGFAENPTDRCYYCKTELFDEVAKAALPLGISKVADGSNADDTSDYRPGMKAACELGVMSPLMECGMTKEDIRECSRDAALPTADKPAFACLASRFPYGTKITEEKLNAVDAMEMFLRDNGFRVIRVRHHGETARIELGEDEIARLLDVDLRAAVTAKAKECGFLYAAVDLQGYRTGSMNEGLDV